MFAYGLLNLIASFVNQECGNVSKLIYAKENVVYMLVSTIHRKIRVLEYLSRVLKQSGRFAALAQKFLGFFG